MSVIALADCNNFFVSCERSVDPSLENRPVVVLSNNDGCVISRSGEAKLLGIEMGVPYFKIRDQIKRQRIAVFSSNFTLYALKSSAVFESLNQFTPHSEFYSIDESFLSLSHVPAKLLREYALEIQATVRKETGIPVSIGIAETKTLAKLANAIAKRNLRMKGLLNLYQSPQMDMALSRVPVERVWGVGRRLSASLQKARIYTARDLRDKSDHWILKRYSTVLLKTVLELRGQPCFPIQSSRPPRKSVMYSRSFGNLITSAAQMESVIAHFTAKAAEKLREDQLATRHLSIYMRTSRHIDRHLRYSSGGDVAFSTPTDCTHDLIREAVKLSRQVFRDGYAYYKASIGLNDTVPATQKQMNLFETRNVQQLDTLMETLDRINRQYGPNTLKYAVEGLDKEPGWQSRQSILSQSGLSVSQSLSPAALLGAERRRPLLGFVHPVHG
jgi:DNA polymerase V